MNVTQIAQELWRFLYVLKYGMTVNHPIFTKLTQICPLFVKNSFAEYSQNPMNVQSRVQGYRQSRQTSLQHKKSIETVENVRSSQFGTMRTLDD